MGQLRRMTETVRASCGAGSFRTACFVRIPQDRTGMGL